jgi:hypothetical protein
MDILPNLPTPVSGVPPIEPFTNDSLKPAPGPPKKLKVDGNKQEDKRMGCDCKFPPPVPNIKPGSAQLSIIQILPP